MKTLKCTVITTLVLAFAATPLRAQSDAPRGEGSQVIFNILQMALEFKLQQDQARMARITSEKQREEARRQRAFEKWQLEQWYKHSSRSGR